MKMKVGIRFGIALAALFCLSQVQAAAPAALQEKVEALKKSLQQNQANLRQYQWVETVTVSKDGNVKSQKQYSCYYGLDGALQKTELNSSQPDQDQGGGRPRGFLRRQIVADKKEEMADYMKSATALIKKYVPPQASLIQAAKEANNISMKPGAGGVQLVIQNYLLPGDSLSLGLDMAKSDLNSLSVNTYLDDPKDTVTLQTSFANLPDGTSYTKQTLMTVKDKGITVLTENAGYKKMNN